MSHATQRHNRRYFGDYRQIMNRCVLPSNGSEDLSEQVQSQVLSAVQWTLEQALDEEVKEHLGCERSERGLRPRRPEETRSGWYERELWTQYGCIPALRVPKLRRGHRRLMGETITRYARCGGPCWDQQLLHDCWGQSLRDLQEAMQHRVGDVWSLGTCNRLVLGLEARAQACKTARLETPPPLVLVDGLWLKFAVPTGEWHNDSMGRRRAVRRKHKRVMLTALGLYGAGHWAICTWHVADTEEAPAWSSFLGALYVKGITAQRTALVVSDGAKGLAKALYSHLPGVPHQRCIFHKIKTIADYLLYSELKVDAWGNDVSVERQAKLAYKKEILADAGDRYRTDVDVEIRARAQAFRDKWEAREPKAVAVLMNDFELTWSSLSVHFPRAHVSLIRTTNLLERFHKAVRRKQRDIGM